MTIQPKNLNPLLIKDPKSLYSTNLLKGKVLKIASIINLISILIFASYLFSFIGISKAVIPIANMATGIAIPFLSVSFTILNDISKSSYKAANFYKKILLELKTLKTEDDYQIRNYLKKIKCHNIKDIKQTLLALAHFRVWSNTKESSLNEIKKIKNTQTNNENFKYKMLKLTHEIYEKEVLNAKLKLAQIHHIINNPTDKKMLSDFGKIFTMSFSKRMASFLQGDDFYFIFHDNIQKQRQRKGLSFTDVDVMEIQDISKLIYNN